ncbi:MAG: PAS domain S-box protein [Acidobacteriota bacterium]|nr:PAS domain S-box protein [Acidobacteriota bacterium]
MPSPGEPLDFTFFADAFRDSPAASVALSADGKVLFWNRAAEAIFGWSAAEVVGHPLPFIPTDRLEEHREMRRHDLEGASFTGRHIRRMRRDGTALDLTVSTAPVRAADGTVTGILSIYTDISASKRTEETHRRQIALADAQLVQLERFYATAPIGLGFVGPDLRYVRVNERLAQMNGRAAAEHAGKPIGQIAPELAAPVEEACRRAFATGEAVTEFEARAATPALAGAARDWLISVHPLRQPDGEVLGATLVMSDVTERKQFLEELSRQERLLRLTIDGMPGLVSYLDRDFCYRFNNRGYADWYQLPIASITGRPVAEMVGPEVFARIRPYLERAFRGEEMTVEHTATFAGRTREVRATYVPERGPDGAVRGIIAVVQDVTEQKRSEQALRRSEERFRRMVEIAAEGIWITDTEGCTTFANARMADILGYTPDEMTGRPFVDFLDPEEVDRARRTFESRKHGDRSPREFRFRRRDGALIWLDITAAPVRDETERLTGILGMCTDVTERKLAERQLRQTQKLESLGILAGGIAHDFNNLLVGIMGNASLAADTLGEDAPCYDMLQDVIAASERAAQLTRKLLAYAGRDHGAVEAVDLAQLVRDLAPLLGSSVPKLVKLDLHLEEVPPVEGDPAQLQQVVMNLLINAAESIPPGQPGTVRLSVAACSLVLFDRRRVLIPIESPAEDYIAFTVSDSGCGMDAATQVRIFDPFFTTKFDGRGLGLSAVLGIVRSHHGTISLDSAPGKGTTFTVLLPVGRGLPVPVNAPPARAAKPVESGTILVVDDEPGVRSMAQRVLERNGWTVLCAENGLHALETVKEHPEIRAVLLDLAMPVMSGDAAAEQIRRMLPGLPIVLSSGYSESDARERFGTGILTGFLENPYSPKRLLERIAEVLQ